MLPNVHSEPPLPGLQKVPDQETVEIDFYLWAQKQGLGNSLYCLPWPQFLVPTTALLTCPVYFLILQAIGVLENPSLYMATRSMYVAYPALPIPFPQKATKG